MKASDLTPENRFVGMFVGPTKCGKTVAAGSFPKPLHILDFDGRIRGLLGASWIDRSDITYDYFPPKESGMVERLNKALEVYETYQTIGQYDMLPKTLVLDSLTSQTFAMVCQSLPLTHSNTKGEKGRGKYLGITPMAGPEDYGFEATVTYSIMSFFRSLKIQNIIVSAHMVQKYGKPPGANNEYAENTIIGEKLSVRDKIGENIGIYFDHCFRFDKRESAGSERFIVKFRGDSPLGTSYEKLPAGEVDITGKSFYDVMMKYVSVEPTKLEVVK